MVKSIIFNCNGVLVNTRGIAIDIYNAIAQKKGYKLIRPEEVQAFSSMSIRERCSELGIPYHQMPVIGIAIKTRYQEHLLSLQAVKGIPELLQSLRNQGYRLGMLTSNSQRNTQTFLTNNGIDIFDYEHYSHNPFTKRKAIQQYINKYKPDKDTLLYVGDELRDIQACRQAGIRCIGVTWGYDSPSLLEQGSPDYIAEVPEDILSYLTGR